MISMRMHYSWMIPRRQIFRGSLESVHQKLVLNQDSKAQILNQILDHNTSQKKNLCITLQRNLHSDSEEDKLWRIQPQLQEVLDQVDMSLRLVQCHQRNKTSLDGPYQKQEEQQSVNAKPQIEIRPMIQDQLCNNNAIQRIKQHQELILDRQTEGIVIN